VSGRVGDVELEEIIMRKVLSFVALFCFFISSCNSNDETFSSKIYFWSDRDGQKQIYTMNPDGSNQQKISDLPDWDFSRSQLSPNHQHLSVIRERDRNYSIFVIDLMGNVVGSSSPNFDTADDFPDWSPDSQFIAFESSRDVPEGIYTMKYDGTEIKRLTKQSDQLSVCPVWSTDGKKIAFQFSKGPMIFDGYFMDADGSNVQRFGNSTGGTGYYCPPVSWSPDSKWVGTNGTEIIYLASVYNNRFGSIRVVSPDLGYSTNIPPVWSPDGKRLLFVIDTHEPTHHNRDEIYIVGIDGTMLMNLTNNDSANDTNQCGRRMVNL
jgi:Tol biopolymer transport system component